MSDDPASAGLVEAARPSGSGSSRRGVLRSAMVIGAAGVVVGPLAACGKKSESGPTGSPTGAGSGKPTGEITKTSSVPVEGGQVLTVSGTKVVVTQPEADTYKAFTAICTHAGCTVNSIVKDVITCPCHGSQFDASTGAVVRGPATAPLASIPIAVQGGSISFA